MSHPLPAPKIDPEHTLPNQPFFSWLQTQTTLVISQLVGLLSFIYVLASSIYYVRENLEHSELLERINQTLLFVDFAHIVLLVVFIVVLIKILDDNNQGSYRAGVVYTRVFNESLNASQLKALLRTSKIQLRKFKLYFLFFWFAMLVLYISFAFKHSSQEIDPPPLPISGLVSVPCPPDLGGTCYNLPPPYLLNGIATVPCPPDLDGTCYKFSSPHLLTEFEVFKKLRFPFLTFALNNLSLLFVFWCFIVLYLPLYNKQSKKRHSLLVNYSSFIVVLFTVSFLLLFSIKSGGFTQTSLTAYVTVFNALSGTLNAVVLALLIARLDSKLIGLPSWLICILYLYSAVQPLFVVFEQPGQVFQIIQTSVLIVVLIFKIYFFCIIIYTLQTGRMLNYLFCFPFVNKRVNSIFDNQFEIKTHKEKEHSFSFSIMKKNDRVYSTETHYQSRKACDKRISELRELMKQRSSYKYGEECGTHWVKIVDSDDDVICESKGLKSEDEARDLIDESMEKIPYCKYDRDYN